MRTSPAVLALVAVESSVVTVGTIELLRGSRPGPQGALAVDPARGPAASTSVSPDSLVPVMRASDRPTHYEDRLAELTALMGAELYGDD